MKLLIVGNRGGSNVGGCFERAAAQAGISVKMQESRLAVEAPALVRIANWHLLGRRPSRLGAFGKETVEFCRRWKPDVLLATGIAPLEKSALDAISAEGTVLLNYLTDDPWNPAHHAEWFIRSLPGYDCVYSVRRANMDDLRTAGTRRVEFVPFAYDPALHHPYPDAAPGESWDVIFTGGADWDREPYVRALVEKNFKIGLFGSYWERFAATRRIARGQADVDKVGRATAASKVAVCLVRRANRDGNCMRTFEIPAIGTCMVAEDTAEHREIFGKDGDAVVYFKTPKELADRTAALLGDEAARRRLAGAAHRLISENGHTYKDRLAFMLSTAPAGRSAR